jgi:hypothetical protein
LNYNPWLKEGVELVYELSNEGLLLGIVSRTLIFIVVDTHQMQLVPVDECMMGVTTY